MNPLIHGDKFVLLNRTVTPDGMGGWFTQWQDGAEFTCLLSLDSTMEARVAEQSGVSSVFSGMVDKKFPIEYHNVFKRVSDNSVFRVTSEPADKQTPGIATFAVKSFSAEKFELPSN